MPNIGQSQFKYIPQYANRVQSNTPQSYGYRDNAPLTESVTSPSNVTPEVPIEQSITVTSSQGFWTTKKIVIAVVVICAVLAIGGGVAAAVVLTQRTDSTTTLTTTTATTSTMTTETTTTTTSVTTTTTTSTTSTSTTTQTTTTATTTTSTTTTTTPINPCSGGSLRWNTTGTTVISSSQLTNTEGLYVTSNNNVYVVDEYSNSVIWRLLNNATTATIVAGTAQSRGSASTQLNYPQDVYLDSNGNLYVTDYYNYRVQKYVGGSTSGTTIAGITGSPGWGLSQLYGPRHMAFDANETYMYVVDYDTHRVIRHLTNSVSGTSGTVVAGTGGASNTNTTLYYPWGIHYLPSVSSDLYITNYYGHSVIRWTPGASIGSFVAGVPGVSGQTPILLNNPTGVKIDTYLNVYVADMSNHRIQMFCANAQTGITIAGTGVAGNSATQLNQPRSIGFDSAMNMYIGDTGNARVQKFKKL